MGATSDDTADLVELGLLDRLLHHPVVVQIEGSSPRLNGCALDKPPIGALWASKEISNWNRGAIDPQQSSTGLIYVAYVETRQQIIDLGKFLSVQALENECCPPRASSSRIPRTVRGSKPSTSILTTTRSESNVIAMGRR